MPSLNMLVRVLDHHHGRVDHRADGNRNTTQRHDVGVHALVLHDDERHQHTQRQRNDGHECRAHMKQEHETHHRDDDKFFEQLGGEVIDRAQYQFGAIVRRHDLDTRRQTGLQLFELGLHGGDGVERVFARAHDDDAARNFAFAVEFGDAAAHLRAGLDARHILQQHRHTGLAGRERNRAEVIERFQIAADAHHVLGLAQLQHRAAGFAIRVLDRTDHFGVADVVGAQPIRIEHHLILFDHAADRGNLGDVGQGLQFVFEKPILQRAQFGQIVFTGAIHQRVFVNPADTRRVRPQ